ncbi:MAG: dinitrogenase iron-molybdenum cofactor biosynthesis protein [Zetaproteobacteria bacterium CG02_land_8_20_14_3_00_50_9]|nr:MAG: dinitrogenase iron-molybdenum cofactor biosynthesis protein [Zetaproteobacteria bacterium CG17_big_fil_post_rev_8_21_14_2_50_50_13]PIV30105.1 MAG: dinitrogenase iron-molybdenum cofactor biosynthesis protein [Zetaproteobacteria bacterium CG02_land_8_20_14_3_00_50_9]PIY56468.1 MAG: dinitrogenase iron-molybdenum cofactor biosynthesis protein [Zetaproteobacteria bacterium CG_4_10_14_0_8_um_filter_49_80]
MARKGLSRELALRIGLAARALSDTEPKALLDILTDILEMPITRSKLDGMTLEQLKSGCNGALGNVDAESLEQAVKYLRGEEGISPRFAAPVPYNEGDMADSIRVAIASNGGDLLDGHFASCQGFLVYQLSATDMQLIDVRQTDDAVEAEDKTAWLVEQIADCHVLYVVSVGGPAAAKVIKAGIHPIKMPDGGEAAVILSQLQGVLASSPPPWLAKILGVGPEQRVRFESEQDDWEQEA